MNFFSPINQLIAIIVICLINFPLIVFSLSWSNCESDNPILTFNSLTIEGDPIVIGDPVKPLKVSLDVNLTKPIDDQLIVKISISKVFTIFGKRLTLPSFPCIKGYGSCERNLCDFLTSDENSFGCPLIRSLDRPCLCPIDPGQLIVNDFNGHIDLSNVPKMLLWLSSGDYNVNIVINRDDQSVTCLDLDLDLEMTNISHEED
ncbi:ganglioside GM2 activator-like [Panonychus citri]|nr:ganglioside GM2 activator-like [Panonychus citri]XP_053203873.1 ganglioside GM2 activator-like [Panonychus citri]